MIILDTAHIDPAHLTGLPDPTTVIPSHRVAGWLMHIIDWLLDHIGLSGNSTAQEVAYIVVVAVVALLVGMFIRWLLITITNGILRVRNNRVGQQLLKEHTLASCTHIVPPLVFMALVPFAFNHHTQTLWYIMRGAGVYLTIAFCVGLCAVLRFIFNRYNEHENTRNLPIKGILNIAIGLVWIIAVILCVSIVIDKSPAALLAGMTAFAAALMLIFKDSILGFVAGIQIASNDMVHVGDWIVVPSTPANGTVLDMSLSTVKVQNWDNTIVTVPPYTLVSGSMQNWRGMSQSGMRRIMRDFTIDYDTIVPLTDELLQSVLAKYPILKPAVDAIRKGEPSDQEWMVNPGIRDTNGTLESNLGLYRLYLCLYLENNPQIHPGSQILVRLMDPTIYGYPLQIWCWTTTPVWNAYEAIQSAIMEHVALTVADFGLAIYNAGSETLTIPENEITMRATTTPPEGKTPA